MAVGFEIGHFSYEAPCERGAALTGASTEYGFFSTFAADSRR